MLIVDEIESTLTGAAGFDAAQTIPGPDAQVSVSEGAGTVFPVSPTVTISAFMLAGDQDYFAIDLEAGQSVTFDVDGTSGGLDLELFLYAPGDTVFSAASIDSGFADGGSTTTFDPFLGFTATATGTWRIGLEASTGVQAGAYLLRISIADLPTLFEGGEADDDAKTGSGDDTLLGFAEGAETAPSGDDILNGSIGQDLLRGGDGDDRLDGGGGNNTLDGGVGADLLVAGTGADSVLGGTGADTAETGEGRDTVDAGQGADSVSGGQGGDLLVGGDGDDTLLGEVEAPSALSLAYDTLRGGNGDDSLEGGFGGGRMEGGAGADTLLAGSAIEPVGDPLGNSTLLGQAGADLLRGDFHDDLILGGADADTLSGGFGTNQLLGGAGDDRIFAVAIGSSLGGALGNMLDGGDGNDTLTGGPGAVLSAGAGNDRVEIGGLDGGAGINALDADGGVGADTLAIAETFSADVLEFAIGADGVGRLSTWKTVRDGEAVTGVITGPAAVFEGFEAFVVDGSAATDRITGGAGGDLIQGLGGSFDRLFGGGGADTLVAGRLGDPMSSATGTLLRGGLGNDLIQLSGPTTTGTADGGMGADSMIGEGLGGSAVMAGGDGADTVSLLRGSWAADGGAGDDLLIARLGDSFFGASVEVASGEGFARGEVSVDFAGFERLWFTAGFGDDTLQGGDGADTLDGGTSGADSLSGGLGNDVYVIFGTGTQVLDAGGLDTLRSAQSWTLAEGLEALALLGTDPLTGTGNTGANTLTGNAGANTLAGAGGNDLLQGGAGLDSLAGGLGADTLNGGAEADRLRGGAEFDTFVLRLNDAEGDVVADFAGNGAAAGDVLRVVGYGAGATIALQNAAGFTWRIQGGSGSDLVVLAGVTALAAGDVVFA
jgi:Ca2+-binding RTX toxin-like protein